MSSAAACRATATVGAILLPLLAAACGGRTSEEDREFALEPTYRIGQVEGAPEYALGQITDVVPLADGSFFTCDATDFVLRRYDAEGKFVRTVGRRGKGPGEYSGCNTSRLIGDSLIVVSDPRSARFVFFRADGTYHSILQQLVPGGLGGSTALRVDDLGRLWKRGTKLHETPPDRSEGEFGRTQFLIIDRARGVVDSILVPGGAGSSRGLGFGLGTSEGMLAYVPPDTVWDVTPSGTFVVAGTDAYRITVRAREGSTRDIVRESAPVAYEPEEWAQWEAWREYFRVYRGATYVPVPERKPIIRGLRVDDRDRLWVHVHVRAEARDIPPRKPDDPRPLLT